MTELDKLKKRIKKKFKSISGFCRCNGIDPYEVQILFACEKANPMSSSKRSKRLNEISDLCTSSSPNDDPKRITADLRSSIGKKITEMGGVDKFHDDNPQFPRTSIYQILDGRRKNITSKVLELIKHLGIEHG